MKKRVTLFFCLAIGAYMWLGHSSGAANRQDADRTGGPLSNNGNTYCSMCHSGGNFGTSVSLTLLSADGDTITEYAPETAYTLRVAISAEGAAAYGFQAVALDTANAQAGMYGEAPAGTAVVAVNGVDYAEHTERDTDGMWDIPWTAPGVGAGPVSFYAAGNAVNNADGTQGDDPDTTSLVIPEALGASLADVAQEIQLEVAPNPTQDYLNIRWSADLVKPESIQVINAAGQMMKERDVWNVANSNLEINVQDMPAGVYFIRAISDNGIQTKRFSKF